MNWLAFIASIIRSLAAPTAAVVLVWMFRKPLTALLPLLARVKYKNLEVDFDRELRKVEKEAKGLISVPAPALSALPPVASSGPESESSDSRRRLSDAERLVAEVPAAAVIVAWTAVEVELRATAIRLGIDRRPLSVNVVRGIAQALVYQEVISPPVVSVLQGMQRLRNIAVHGLESAQGFTITAEAAGEFVALAGGIVEQLLETPTRK